MINEEIYNTFQFYTSRGHFQVPMCTDEIRLNQLITTSAMFKNRMYSVIIGWSQCSFLLLFDELRIVVHKEVLWLLIQTWYLRWATWREWASNSLVDEAEGREFSFLTAWWMKLFVRLVERARRLRYLLPEGRGLNRPVRGGWCRSQSWLLCGWGGWCMCLARRGVGHPWSSSCVHYTLQGSPVVVSEAPAPHSDAAGQDALNGVPVECALDGWEVVNNNLFGFADIQ